MQSFRKPRGPILPVPADLIRKCPVCGNDIPYKNKQCWRQAHRGNFACKPCADDKVRLKTQSLEWRAEQSERLEVVWDDPSSVFNTEEYREVLGTAQINRTDDRKPGAKLAWSHRSEASKKLFIENGNTASAKARRSASLLKYYLEHPEDAIERGRKTSERFAAMSPEERRELAEPMIAATQRTGGSSKIEKRLALIVEPFGFVHHMKIANKWVDFVNEEKKVALELFGIWHHAHPQFDERIEKQYDGLHPNKMISPAEIRRLDEARLEVIKAEGYRTFVVWDHEIKSLSDEQIIELLRSRSIL